MGSHIAKMSKHRKQDSEELEPIENFKFHDVFAEETNNGLCFNDIYMPEEILMIILSFVDAKEILNATLVCRKWCNIIKSETFWLMKYSKQCKKKPKILPWYVYYAFFATDYFDKNLIKNGNGQKQFDHWKIVLNYGDAFKIEDPPVGADPLPLEVPEFNGKTGCFATSYYECNKLQEISLQNNRLMQLILNKFKPHIYLSEWVAGRFDCGCVYNLWCKLYGTKPVTVKSETSDPQPIHAVNVHEDSDEEFYYESIYYTSDDESEEPHLYINHTGVRIEQWSGSSWSKVELLAKDYPDGVQRIVFQHEGKDTQFWKGHYGSKMAGGVLKILFDTIEPLETNMAV